MMIVIRQTKFNWLGITKDIKKFLKECSLSLFKNCEKTKQNPTLLQIISEKPRHIYQINMVLLAQDYQTNDYKYLVTIADHFSKYFWCKPVPTKEAK